MHVCVCVDVCMCVCVCMFVCVQKKIGATKLGATPVTLSKASVYTHIYQLCVYVLDLVWLLQESVSLCDDVLYLLMCACVCVCVCVCLKCACVYVCVHAKCVCLCVYVHVCPV